MHLLFKLGHNFSLWHCLATCCQDDIAEALWLEIWNCHINLILLISHWLTTIFFNHLDTFWDQKTFCFKEDVEIASKDFLTLKPFEFYHSGINNLVTRWQKYIDVCSGIIFWLIQMLLQLNIDSKTGHYFLNDLITHSSGIFNSMILLINSNLGNKSISNPICDLITV